MEAQPVVRLEGVAKSYRLGRVQVPALAGVTLDVARGDFLALAGPSGSGKTTLLNLIGCIDKPDAGRVLVDGIDVTPLPLHRLAVTRREVLGFVFQTFNLIPVLTAYENVEYPLLIHRRGGDIGARVRAALEHVGLAERARHRRERAKEALAAVGLAERMHHRPTELSGGQQQRVAIARALVGDPALVLADEPTANLDSRTGHDIIELMRRLNRERSTTFVFSTHDPRIMTAADRVLEISDGRLR